MKAPGLRAVLMAAATVLAGCGGGDPEPIRLPSNVKLLSVTAYGDIGAGQGDTTDTQDLLTAGLGKTGLSGDPPGFVDPARPTTAELRRRAIYTNYRALLDISAAGGYGSLYGPNVDIDGSATTSEGKIAGKEYLGYSDDGTGTKTVTLMVQIPATFDASRACIVAAASSDSQGIYGAIATAGEWGLKHGCAVAYTDAGKGTGYHDLATDEVNSFDGHLVARSAQGLPPHFASSLSGNPLATFNAAFPHRVAYKHVHSQQNPEKDWGRNVLDAIHMAFWALNEEFPSSRRRGARRIVPSNTIVIASSTSNGGGASLRAAEQDADGLIDGVAVGSPNAQPGDMAGVTVNLSGTLVAGAGKSLADYFTYRMIYELCAALAPARQPVPITYRMLGWGGASLNGVAVERCKSLFPYSPQVGILADASLYGMRSYGWNDPYHDSMHASHYQLVDAYVAYGYVTAYGRFSVDDNLCGFSLANADPAGNVIPQDLSKTLLFAIGNGLSTGSDLIYNDSVGGAKLYHYGVSPSSGRADASLDGMRCLRSLVTGIDEVSNLPLAGSALASSQRVQTGIREVLLTGNLRAKPTVIVAGRSDAFMPVNHTARAYAALNSKIEGALSNLRYYEIEHGQHFDAFLADAANGGVHGYENLFVPMHRYFVQGMDLLWVTLTAGAPLPPSQVVRTVPRGGTTTPAPAISASCVPPIAAEPDAANAITASFGSIAVP